MGFFKRLTAMWSEKAERRAENCAREHRMTLLEHYPVEKEACLATEELRKSGLEWLGAPIQALPPEPAREMVVLLPRKHFIGLASALDATTHPVHDGKEYGFEGFYALNVGGAAYVCMSAGPLWEKAAAPGA